MKGLRLDIYKGKHDCSNGGYSFLHNAVTLVTNNCIHYINIAVPAIVPVTEDAPAVWISCIKTGSKTFFYIRPVENPSMVPFTWGGTFVYSSDGRFPFEGALKFHDRQE